MDKGDRGLCVGMVTLLPVVFCSQCIRSVFARQNSESRRWPASTAAHLASSLPVLSTRSSNQPLTARDRRRTRAQGAEQLDDEGAAAVAGLMASARGIGAPATSPLDYKQVTPAVMAGVWEVIFLGKPPTL